MELLHVNLGFYPTTKNEASQGYNGNIIQPAKNPRRIDKILKKDLDANVPSQGEQT